MDNNNKPTIVNGDYVSDKIEELIKKFNNTNGNNNYSQRDLLKYLIGRIDEIDNKVDSTNLKLDNHINHLSQRVTATETNISILKWLAGLIMVGMVSLIVNTFVIL